MFKALDFFAGSGLVSLGLAPEFQTIWANDNCAKKRDIYVANNGADHFHSDSICDISGANLPNADLAWASFPCQDLSLAGNLGGMRDGTRSGLFWQWVRVLTEMQSAGKKPAVLVAENVVGFLVADGGTHFRQAYHALRSLGYRLGAVVMDAGAFLPQSRKRVFIIAAAPEISLAGLTQQAPSEPFHPKSIVKAAFLIDDPAWVWWSLPLPNKRRPEFSDLCEREASCDPSSKTETLRSMLSPLNNRKLLRVLRGNSFFAGTGYRRSRPDTTGQSIQRLEIRFDGTAGCLRTPKGGSSRQTVIIADHGTVHSRLMTVRECARLMGAPDSYRLPGSYNDGYSAMGDAVAVPVTRWLSRYLLAPLAERAALLPGAEALSPASREYLEVSDARHPINA